MNTQGKFITFEGGEGAGKTTQSALLLKSFVNAKIKAIHTREPGGTDGAECIRKLLVKGDVNRWLPETETLLHFAARVDHVARLIKPALNDGNYVVCDRFIDSTFAYQAYGHQLGDDIINQLHAIMLKGFCPDVTFILDASVNTGIARADARGADEDRYERMDKAFHQRVLDGFRTIANKDALRCVQINAAKPIEDIHLEIIHTLNQRFSLELEQAI